MTQWLLPVFIFFVWALWIAACAVQAAVKDARLGIPAGERRGTSVFPGMPLFPLAFWGIAWIIDLALRPWGSVLVGAFHVILGGMLIVSVIRGNRTLRTIDGPT